MGANVLDGGDGFDTLRGHTGHNYHINLTNNTLTYLENGHFNIYSGGVLEAAGLSKNGADVLQVDAYYRVYESSDSPGDTLFQEFENQIMVIGLKLEKLLLVQGQLIY